jgi:zinc protease
MKQLRLSILLGFSCALLGFICAVQPLAAFAQSLDTKLPFDSEVRTGKLPNGLTYYIRHNSYPEHRAELRLVIHAGSVLEDADQQGLAHLNEHMCFNGTAKYPHNSLESFLEEHGARFGADLNASTSFDETIYKESLPTDQGTVLDSGIDILAEWAHNVSFDSAEVEKERGVVGEEWRMGRGAFERIYNKQAPIIFAGSQYGNRNPIGLKAVIDTAYRSTVMRFYHDWYRPDLMAVVVVGDFDAGQMEQKIKSLFAPLTNPTNERPRTEYPIPPHQETLVAVNTDKEMPQTIFSMMFVRQKEDETTVAGYRETELVTGLYNQMLNDRIQEAIQKGEAPFAYAGAGDGGFIGHFNAFNIFALLRQDSIQSGVKSVLAQVYRVKETGFTQTELDRAKKALLSQMEKTWNERAKTKNTDFVREYISNFTENEPSPGIDYEYTLYKQYVPGISLAEVNALSPKLLDHASPVMTFEGPENSSFTPPTKEELLGALSSVEHEHLAAYKDNVSNARLLAKIPTPGKITSEKKLASIGVTIWQLSNGARVVFKPTDFKDDEILFHATAPGGSSTAPDVDYLSAQMSDNIVENSGLASFDATSIKKMLAGKEVEVSPYVSSLQQGLSGHSTKRDVETLFQLTHLYMSEPRYDSTASAAFITREKAMLQNMHKMPEMAYNDSLQVTMAQHHYRARPQTAESMDEVNTPKAYDYYKKLFSDASGFTFFFVGNIDVKTLRPLVEEYLASLPSSNQHTTWRDVGMHPPKGVIVKNVYSGTEPKSVVSMIYTGHKQFSRENRFRLSAMAQAFQMVLLDDIREDKSGVYYVRVSPSFSKYPHDEYRITINFGCNPARVDELVAEVRKQLDTLTMRPLTGTYVERVHKILTNELQVNLRENKYWMSELQDAFWNDLDPTAIPESSSLIDTITPQSVYETAKDYFDSNNCVQVVLYPEKTPDKKL